MHSLMAFLCVHLNVQHMKSFHMTAQAGLAGAIVWFQCAYRMYGHRRSCKYELHTSDVLSLSLWVDVMERVSSATVKQT